MKNALLYIIGLIAIAVVIGYQIDDQRFPELPAAGKNEKVATFAGGCFWAMEEAMSELNGVNKVVSGYAGGRVKNPTYELVCTRTTGHAESVQVYYNPEIIDYATLAEAFFYAHDPTTLNQQGPDVGDDYRSAVFYRNEAEKVILNDAIKKITNSNHYQNTIVTEISRFEAFYPAEKYHQGYFRSHPNQSYIKNVSLPKVLKLRREMNSKLKPEFRS
jgi:peptide-methionine (S)-S-oxide reductase